MYCDCVLANAGFQPGYIIVLAISAVFVGGGIAFFGRSMRRSELGEIEAAKGHVFGADD